MSPATDLADCSALTLLALYRAGDASPVEATRAVLARIERFDPLLNAFCHLAPDDAIAAARASEARWRKGAPCGELDGVPVSVKDLILAAGWPTLRACGPMCATVPNGDSGNAGTRPNDAFMPGIPQNDDGMRTEPAPSVPTASGPIPAATAAAAPPDEPPGVRPRSHGLRAGPPWRGSVVGRIPNSGSFVVPTTTKPAARSRRTR